jgi:hypothetical protein
MAIPIAHAKIAPPDLLLSSSTRSTPSQASITAWFSARNRNVKPRTCRVDDFTSGKRGENLRVTEAGYKEKRL